MLVALVDERERLPAALDGRRAEQDDLDAERLRRKDGLAQVLVARQEVGRRDGALPRQREEVERDEGVDALLLPLDDAAEAQLQPRE